MPEKSLPPDGDGWDEWRKHVLITQKESKVELAELSKKQDQIWKCVSNHNKETSDEFAKLRIEVRNRIDREKDNIGDDIKEIKESQSKIEKNMVSRDELDKVKDSAGKTNTAVSNLQLKSGLWGLVAGLIPAIGVILWWIITTNFFQ